LTDIDPILSQGSVVIAQVYDAQNKSSHWVLVTSKTSYGDYRILDPGFSNNTTLVASFQNIYKYVIIPSQ